MTDREAHAGSHEEATAEYRRGAKVVKVKYNSKTVPRETKENLKVKLKITQFKGK